MTKPDWNVVRALTFDAAGTLLEPWPSVGQVYSEAAQEAGFGTFDPGELNRRFHQAWSHRGAFDYSRLAWARLVASALAGLTPAAKDPDLFEALWHRFIQARSWKIFPDVIPSLQALSAAGWPLAVVSNWDERLHPVLRNTGLAEYFKFVLPSTEAPAPKPDPRIFQRAAERLGVPPAAVLHIGDSQREDISGARLAGMLAVRIDRAPNRVSNDSIGSLAELPQFLALR